MSCRLPIFLAAGIVLMSQGAGAQMMFTGTDAVPGNVPAGIEAYAQSCVTCHGARLEGSPFGPALVGEAFMKKWQGKPAAELVTLMQNTMPPKGTSAAGSVKAEVFSDLAAFLDMANLHGPAQAGLLAPANAPATADPITETQATANAKRRLSSLSRVTEKMLAAPPDADWLMWRRTFDAAGHSPLRQIHRRNVQRMTRIWSVELAQSSNEITPLVHDGVLFVLSGGTLLAIDAVTGKSLWKHVRGNGQASRMKSVALFGDAVYVCAPDGHVLALDARSGRVLWDQAIYDNRARRAGVGLSSGPLIARGVVMVGAALGLANRGGSFIVGLDAATGAERWRFFTIARPGSPGGDSWNDAPVEERFGGGVWTTGSYDSSLNLAYFGIGNTYTTATLLQPRAGANGVTANDGLYTDSTVALRPETGELVWHHQHHRRDVWDQDWAFEQTVVTLGRGANARRAVVTSGKTGIFEAVDAATGRFIFAHDSGLTNLFTGIDRTTGAKQPSPGMEPAPGKTLLLCPSNFGARNWPATSLNPATRVLFVPMLESCADFTWQPQGAGGSASGGTDIRFSPRPRPDGDGNFGRMIALDLDDQRVVWTHRQRAPLAGSLLGTSGGLVFMGDLERNFSAYDQDNGQLLWRVQLPAAAESTPITYAVDGRQYIAVVSGEASHLGLSNRQFVREPGSPKAGITLTVFALPAR